MKTSHTPFSISDIDLVVSFLFDYPRSCMLMQSIEALQSMCIIPRSPTPLALEDRPRDTLSRDELLELLARRDVS